MRTAVRLKLANRCREEAGRAAGLRPWRDGLAAPGMWRKRRHFGAGSAPAAAVALPGAVAPQPRRRPRRRPRRLCNPGHVATVPLFAPFPPPVTFSCYEPPQPCRDSRHPAVRLVFAGLRQGPRRCVNIPRAPVITAGPGVPVTTCPTSCHSTQPCHDRNCHRVTPGPRPSAPAVNPALGGFFWGGVHSKKPLVYKKRGF